MGHGVNGGGPTVFLSDLLRSGEGVCIPAETEKVTLTLPELDTIESCSLNWEASQQDGEGRATKPPFLGKGIRCTDTRCDGELTTTNSTPQSAITTEKKGR